MEKLRCLLKANLRCELPFPLALTVGICLMVPVLFGLNNLTARQAAIPMETVVILCGPMLLVPVFLPEQEKALANVMFSKQTPPTVVYGLRVLYNVLLVGLVPGVFTMVMRLQHTDASGLHYLGTLASMLFLGGLGMMGYALSENIAVGYMLPMVWYVSCYGVGNKLGGFDVLRMIHGTFDGKLLQLWVGVGLIVAAVAYRSSRRAQR